MGIRNSFNFSHFNIHTLGYFVNCVVSMKSKENYLRHNAACTYIVLICTWYHRIYYFVALYYMHTMQSYTMLLYKLKCCITFYAALLYILMLYCIYCVTEMLYCIILLLMCCTVLYCC